MKFNTYKLFVLTLLLLFVGCDDFLDRPPLTQENDETAWKNEQNVRLYANKFYPGFTYGGTFYPGFFMGYGSGWTNAYSPLMGFQYSGGKKTD